MKPKQPEPTGQAPHHIYCHLCQAWIPLELGGNRLDHWLDEHRQALIDGRIEVQR